jgi:hypothetical protein
VLKYGDVSIDPQEEAALCLPPKFSVFEKVKSVDMQLETRKAITKI